MRSLEVWFTVGNHWRLKNLWSLCSRRKEGVSAPNCLERSREMLSCFPFGLKHCTLVRIYRLCLSSLAHVRSLSLRVLTCFLGLFPSYSVTLMAGNLPARVWPIICKAFPVYYRIKYTFVRIWLFSVSILFVKFIKYFSTVPSCAL